jgi:hypothetical protein
VTEVAERGSIRCPSQPCYEVWALWDRAEQLALEAGCHEDLPQVFYRRTLVTGRIDGVEADQALKERGGV